MRVFSIQHDRQGLPEVERTSASVDAVAARLISLPEVNGVVVLIKGNRVEVILRLLQDGQMREPEQVRALPPLGFARGRPDKLIRHCRARFAQPRAVVEEKLRRWSEPSTPDALKGRRVVE